MDILKKLGLSLLSFILFLSLTVFSIVYLVDTTLLNADFVTAEVNRLDVPVIFDEFFADAFDSETNISVEIEPGTTVPIDLEEALNETIVELEPWLKEETNNAIYAGYDYLLGETESLNIVIATDQVHDTLRENITEMILALPELEGISEAEIRQHIDEAYDQEVAEFIPTSIEITENDIPGDVIVNLETARFWLGQYNALYWGLISLIVICVAGIILISRKVAEITGTLGIPLFIYGLTGYVIILVAKGQGWTELALEGIPASLQEWSNQLVNNLLAPLQTFDLVLLIVGAALIVFSIVYRFRRPAQEES